MADFYELFYDDPGAQAIPEPGGLDRLKPWLGLDRALPRAVTRPHSAFSTMRSNESPPDPWRLVPLGATWHAPNTIIHERGA